MQFNLKFIGRTVRKVRRRWYWLGNVATQQEFNDYMEERVMPWAFVVWMLFAMLMLGLFESPEHL